MLAGSGEELGETRQSVGGAPLQNKPEHHRLPGKLTVAPSTISASSSVSVEGLKFPVVS